MVPLAGNSGYFLPKPTSPGFSILSSAQPRRSHHPRPPLALRLNAGQQLYDVGVAKVAACLRHNLFRALNTQLVLEAYLQPLKILHENSQTAPPSKLLE